MSRYLVTGGAGFIGSHLVEALVAEGHSVRVLDDLSTGSPKNLPRGVELIVASVEDPLAVRGALEGVDGCFHLAAIASVERTRVEWLRSHSVNLSATINVFEEARRQQVARGEPLSVVYASSAAVYGIPDQIPIVEDSPLRPISAYGADKLGCELHAAVAGGLHDVKTAGLRFFNVYGPRQDPSSPYSGVISIFCKKLLENQKIEIHGDGKQVRDFVYVKDAVNALRLAMASASTKSQVYNVCTGIPTTICELGQMVAHICGVPFRTTLTSPRAGDLRLSLGSPRKALDRLGFSSQVSLEGGLTQTLEHLVVGDSQRKPSLSSEDASPFQRQPIRA